MELKKCHAEKAVLTDQLEYALQERNHAVQERNVLVQERNGLALKAQQEYERAERQSHEIRLQTGSVMFLPVLTISVCSHLLIFMKYIHVPIARQFGKEI